MATPFLLQMPDLDLADHLRVDLAEVERRLADQVRADHPVLGPAANHLLQAGGKRFRPVMTLLAGMISAADDGVGAARHDDVINAAVVVELTHLATLYHDDVMDEAAVRRGADSVNARWGNSTAVLTGDFLFARASDLLADLGPAAVRIQARAFARLVTGQIDETAGPTQGQDRIQHYLSVVADKTASLIAASAQLGSLLSGASPDAVQRLTEFGERIGVAFQLSDDLLDVAADAEDSGKTPGTDLREGVPTLPVLFAQRSVDPADARLLTLLDRPVAEADVAEALALLRQHPAMDMARSELRRHAEAARESLAPLPDGPARRALADLCDVVVKRSG